MNVLTDDTAIKLMCCADAFDAMLAKGEMPTADDLRLAINAMREAVEKRGQEPRSGEEVRS